MHDSFVSQARERRIFSGIISINSLATFALNQLFRTVTSCVAMLRLKFGFDKAVLNRAYFVADNPIIQVCQICFTDD